MWRHREGDARLLPSFPSCLPASVVLRPMSHLSSTSPPARGVSPWASAQSLTFANSIVTYIQYEYYFGTQHETSEEVR